ncbi:MAG: Isomerizing Glutamine-fructose-6-phosphate aminotransferase [Parcubacteria group bacterium GW2011_GWA2_42_11]|nr:MAG: Isomerizing Glutamine-fructose-6-phosphate aminotransferase [Parcubacteria group bacterium GW2011_GWA2_42_11]
MILEGLRRLEYRGYDSCGLVVATVKGLKCFKTAGRITKLKEKIAGKELGGSVGIGHTRWATHGAPNDKNSHPHSDCSGQIWIVHNGIIENYQELKKDLIKSGHKFKSETDSEVLAHLVEEMVQKGISLESAVARALKKVKGTYGLAVMSAAEPEKIVVAKQSSPLLIGLGQDEFIVASDAAAVITHTKKVIYLEDGEIGVINKNDFKILNGEHQVVNKKFQAIDWGVDKAQKKGFAHFMLKEIFEQPEALENSMRGRIVARDGAAKLGGLEKVAEDLKKIERLIIVGCGTAYLAGLVGEYMLEEQAGLPVEVELASEFRYRQPVIDKKTAVLCLSQSGETADTLAALREAKQKGALVLGIVNTVGSTIARETDAGVYNHIGPEIGVASTKAFTSQLTILALLTLFLGRQRKMSLVAGQQIAQELIKLPELIKKILAQSGQIKKLAKKYCQYDNFLVVGRKYNLPVACEGALKIKEISYIHAEGYGAGEMKHGPIALIDKNFPVLGIALKNSVYEKNISNLQELKSRSAPLIALATQGDKGIKKIAKDIIWLPKTLEMLEPILAVVPLQLFAYWCAVLRGCDVDKPRNLAKSVTVE